MIALLKGIVSTRELDRVILDVHGVGYELAVPARDAASLIEGQELLVYVAENIRDDAYELYGFLTVAERGLYLKLVTVNGVGAKMAHGILSVYDVATLSSLIDDEDVTRLTQVSGVGKKTAQRIILELKGKLVATSGGSVAREDPAIQALVQLGYRHEQAVRALEAGDGSADTGERVRAALKELGR